MLAEAVTAAPTEAPPPDEPAVDLAPTDAGRPAGRLSFLPGGANRPPGAVARRLAARLAAARAARLDARRG